MQYGVKLPSKRMKLRRGFSRVAHASDDHSPGPAGDRQHRHKYLSSDRMIVAVELVTYLTASHLLRR